jgi:TolA-binding protein
MVKTIADQNDKVKGMNDDFKKTDEEQAAALEQMKNQIEEMHSTIENLEHQIEAVSNARPDMKESMIHSEIISCIAGLFLCIIFQPIAQKCAVAIAVPKAPKAPKAKPEKKRKGKKEESTPADVPETETFDEPETAKEETAETE